MHMLIVLRTLFQEGNNLEFHYEENLHLNYEKLIKDTRKYYKKKIH